MITVLMVYYAGKNVQMDDIHVVAVHFVLITNLTVILQQNKLGSFY